MVCGLPGRNVFAMLLIAPDLEMVCSHAQVRLAQSLGAQHPHRGGFAAGADRASSKERSLPDSYSDPPHKQTQNAQQLAASAQHPF